MREDVVFKKAFIGLTIAFIPFFIGVEQASAQSKIGYVDSQVILASYPAAVDAQKKLEEENEVWGEEMQQMNQDLRRLREDLDQQSLLLSDAKKKEKEDEIQALTTQIQQFQNQKWGQQGEYFRRQEELMRPVLDMINAVIHRVAEEEECDFIFDSVQGNILYAQEKFDYTDRVLEELEKEAPTTETTR